MIRFHADGKDKVIINKIAYRCTIMPDPVIDVNTLVRRDIRDTEESQGGIINRSEIDDFGTISEVRRSVAMPTTQCAHGTFYDEYPCETCRKHNETKMKRIA